MFCQGNGFYVCFVCVMVMICRSFCDTLPNATTLPLPTGIISTVQTEMSLFTSSSPIAPSNTSENLNTTKSLTTLSSSVTAPTTSPTTTTIMTTNTSTSPTTSRLVLTTTSKLTTRISKTPTIISKDTPASTSDISTNKVTVPTVIYYSTTKNDLTSTALHSTSPGSITEHTDAMTDAPVTNSSTKSITTGLSESYTFSTEKTSLVPTDVSQVMSTKEPAVSTSRIQLTHSTTFATSKQTQLPTSNNGSFSTTSMLFNSTSSQLSPNSTELPTKASSTDVTTESSSTLFTGEPQTTTIVTTTLKIEEQNYDGLSTGGKIALGVCIPLIVVFILVVTVYMFRRRKNTYTAYISLEDYGSWNNAANKNYEV